MSEHDQWPHFFVIGAGKSGTTTLSEVLKHHRQIYVPPVKEPQYFSDPRTYVGDTLFDNRSGYLQLFEQAQSSQLRGDFSTSYFICPEAPARIHKCNPAAKFIIILRDPVTRAFSDYLMLRRDNIAKHEFVAEINAEIDRLGNGKLKGPFLVRTGLYYQNIRNFMQFFPRENFLFLSMRDLITAPQSVYDRIFRFLNVDEMLVNDDLLSEKSNRYVETRSTTLDKLLSSRFCNRLMAKIIPSGFKSILRKLRQRLVFREADKPAMPNEAWPLLRPVFEDDLEKLENLIDFDVARLKESWPALTGESRA